MKAKELVAQIPAFRAYNESKNLSPGTCQLYGKGLAYFYAWFVEHYIEDEEITGRCIREWLASKLRDGNKPATANGYVDALRAFFTFLVLDEVIPEDKNPMRLVKRPRVPMPEIRPLTQEEIKRLLDSFDRHTLAGFRDYMMCLLILDTGLRAGEATSLAIEDVDFEQSRIHVKGKGAKIRFVYMGQMVSATLLDYIANCRRWLGDGDGALFPSAGPRSKHSSLHSKYLTNLVREKFNEIGIPYGSSAHRLRHTFAVNFLRNDGGVFHLQRLLGHSTLNMTRRYVMLAEDDVSEVARKASPMDALALYEPSASPLGRLTEGVGHK